jgi:hypothetical protein
MGYQPPPYGALPLPPGLPPRPVYREPHAIGTAPLLSGMAAALIWFALFGLIGQDLVSYAWWTIAAAVGAWAVALVLSVLGDRGVAVGVAIVSGVALSIAMSFVTYRWITTLDFPLW